MKPVEIKDILGYRFLSGIVAAPSGERAVLTVKQAREESNDYSSDIYLLENGKTRRLTADGKSGSPIWEDSEHILFPAMRDEKDSERAKGGERFSVWYRLNINGGEAERAFEIPAQCGSMKRLGGDTWFFIADIFRDEPDEYKMTAEERKALLERRKEGEDYHILTGIQYRFNGEGFCEGTTNALFTWNMKTGETKRLTGPEVSVEFAEEIDGAIVFSACTVKTTENFFSGIYRYDPKSGKTGTLYPESDMGFAGVYCLAGRLIVRGSDYKIAGLNQNPGFYVLEKGKLTELCQPDAAFGSSVGSDCRLGGGKAFKVYNDELYYSCTVGGGTQLRKMDAQGKTTILNRADGSLDCFDLTEKGKVWGVGLFGMALQEVYEIGRNKAVKALTSFNSDAFEDKFVSKPLPLSVRSHGKKIDGWVLLPMDYDPKKRYPAVLDIHGGPKTVYGPIFYQEMQVWAGRGYFVFFCNPTGSDGRGNAFMDIRGKYGTVDYDDLMNFTDAVLEAYPQIDPARVAVTGGSYGGFMTNWIIGHTGRFACAATQRSISNWFSFYGVSDIGPYFATDQTAGNVFEERDQKKLWQHSPLKYVANVTTPTLFIHSDEDYRCPIDQGLQLYIALLEKGVETRFVWFKGENHELSRSGKPRHRIKRLEEITGWIEKYTK